VKLQRRRSLDTVVKDAFWDVVRDCLIDLFGVPTADASSLALDRRAGVDLAPAEVRSSIYYHREPFDVARDLADSRPLGHSAPGMTLGDPPVRASYELILDRHGLL